MKKILALLVLATLGRADVVGPMPMQLPADGGIWPLSGSVTYALNRSLTGVASSAIDLNGTNGIYLTVTGTASGLVTIWFNNANVTPTTGAFPAYQVQVPGSYYVPIRGRYAILTNETQKAGVRVSAYYYTAVPAVTATNGATGTTITASVPLTVTAYIAGSVPLTVTSSIVSNTASYLPKATTVYSLVSYTSTVTNITTAAGVNAACLVCMTSNGGAAAGFKVQFGTNEAAPAPGPQDNIGHYVAASTTSQCWGPYFPGTHWYAAGVAGTSSMIVDYQQAK